MWRTDGRGFGCHLPGSHAPANGWPELYRKLAIALDEDPDRPKRITGVIADRAFTIRPHIVFNTNRGVASISPERGLPGGKPWSALRTDRSVSTAHAASTAAGRPGSRTGPAKASC